MSRTLWLDTFAGVSGDMWVAALIHAGVPLDVVVDGVAAVGVPGWKARIERVNRGAIAATRFIVEPDGSRAEPSPASGEATSYGHDHGHGHGGGHDHGHDHGGRSAYAGDARQLVGLALAAQGSPDGLAGPEHAEGVPEPEFPGQPWRPWRVIRGMLEGAALPARVKQRALATFGRLAEAEARVHGMAVEDVAFHEVGSVDSIVDVVAVCVALEWLDVERVVVTPLPMGGGTTWSAHGRIPLPAPATLEVLRGFPVRAAPWPGEHVTPTGAALVAALAEPGGLPAMRPERIGYGAGTRDPGTHANVLRAVIGQGDAGGPTEVVELRAQVDDLPGEAVPGLIVAMMAAGALDVTVSPTLMKKGRTGLRIEAVATPDTRGAVGEALLRHGGSFGYRWAPMRREVLARRHVEVQTRFGPVRIKLGERDGNVVVAAPEHDDVAARAAAAGVSVGEVFGAALAGWRG